MTEPETPSTVRPVEYKGEPLDAERGPGLGCFRFQVGLLAFLLVFTPLTVVWNWNPYVSIALLFLTLILLLFTGQTVIFLLRLVAADRRDGRRRPLASATPTVGELEDRAAAAPMTDEAKEPTPDEASTGEANGPSTDEADEPTETVETPATPALPDDERPASPGVRE